MQGSCVRALEPSIDVGRRIGVITGAGTKAFSSGMDLKGMCVQKIRTRVTGTRNISSVAKCLDTELDSALESPYYHVLSIVSGLALSNLELRTMD